MDTNIFKILGSAGVFEILFALKDGSLRFNSLMFVAKLNPGILNRNLKNLIKTNIIVKTDNGYELTSIGLKAIEFAISYDIEYFKQYHSLAKVACVT